MCSVRLWRRIERAGWRLEPGVSVGGIALCILPSRAGPIRTRPGLALDCADSTDVAAIRRVGDLLAGALAQALPGTEINLAVNTVTIAVGP
jgi:hypothetical protein